VKKEDTAQIIRQLQKNGIEYNYLFFENEGHWITNKDNKFNLYYSLERFLTKYLGGNMEKLIYVDQPKDFNPKVEVSACFCKVGDKILFLKRNINKLYGGTWALPAGKLDEGETSSCAIISEVFEETGISMQACDVQFLKTVYVRYPEYDFVYHMFKTELQNFPKDFELNKVEHDEFAWLTLQEGVNFNLIPGEYECIKLLLDQKLL